MAKRKKKHQNDDNNFVNGFSMAEIQHSESKLYVVRLGNDLVANKDKFSFSLREANSLYSDIVNELLDSFYNKKGQESKKAFELLRYVIISPLRIH